jgi:predicted nucleic acid-binding protein
VIVALLDRRERYHERCAAIVETLATPLLTCEAVVAEACYLLRRLSGGSETVLENVVSGVVRVAFQISHGAPAVLEIMHRYRDRQIDLADACLIHMAAEWNTADILTLDRDFEIYRWGRNKSFHPLIGLEH